MLMHKATSIRTRQYLVALAGAAVILIATDARADDHIKQLNHTAVQSVDNIRHTNLKYGKYANSALAFDENFPLEPSNTCQSREDILPVFKLALEEFDLLPSVLFYLEWTEKNIESLSDKLRLKGEFSISKGGAPIQNTGAQARQIKASGRPSARSVHCPGAASLFVPDKMKWKLGLDPNATALFGELNLNSYLNISGEFGKTSQVGFSFKYTF